MLHQANWGPSRNGIRIKLLVGCCLRFELVTKGRWGDYNLGIWIIRDFGIPDPGLILTFQGSILEIPGPVLELHNPEQTMGTESGATSN